MSLAGCHAGVIHQKLDGVVELYEMRQSRHSHMRELRVQHGGRPYRVLYAFDPRRVAILLIGGDKTGDDRWYDKYVPVADQVYDEHIKALEKESK